MSRFPFDKRLWLVAVCCSSFAAEPVQAAGPTSYRQSQNLGDVAQRTERSGRPATSEAQAVSVQRAPGPLWVSTTQSAGKRPIEVARLGNGPHALLIVGSLYGSDSESIDLMDATVQLARNVQTPAYLTVLLIRTANPDALAEHTRTNSNGVDLNRNFPAKDFTSAPTRVTGSHPGSEPETAYLINVVRKYRPACIVHIRSGIGDAPLIMVNDRWPDSQDAVPAEVVLSRFPTNHKAGSFEEFISTEMKLPLATVQLPPNDFPQLQAAELLRFASAHVSKNSPSDQLAQTPQPESIPAEPMKQRPLHADGEKGMVDFLDPPPEFAPTSTIPRQTLDGNPRYFELPPPHDQ